jgi:hypothetical protein
MLFFLYFLAEANSVLRDVAAVAHSELSVVKASIADGRRVLFELFSGVRP